MSIISVDDLFSIKSATDFTRLALEVFRYQCAENALYAQFVKQLGLNKNEVTTLAKIPFLPVQFFKTHSVLCGVNQPEITFSSSGTTGIDTSKHFVKEVSIYRQSFQKGFSHFYGDVTEYTILALLPSYQEREGSSLIYMIDELIKDSRNELSGYFLYNHDELFGLLNHLKAENKKTILIGVTYALLDFLEKYLINFPDLIVMETGGMKGKRKELVREELHEKLCAGLGVSTIHSEYGMTELLSQAYSKGEGKFECPPWMNVLIRDINDPFTYLEPDRVGGINLIDLANIHSCSFLATQDLGKRNEDNRFEVLGRFDNSDMRGCNLLVG